MVVPGIVNRLRYQYRTDPWTFALSVIVLAVGMVLLFDLTWRLTTGDIAISRFVRNVWSGIVFGMAIGLAGIGLAMTYSILKFPNFAHGEYLTFGAFFGWMTAFLIAGFGVERLDLLILVSSDVSTGALGINVLAAPLAITAGLITAIVLTGAFCVALDRIAFKPMRGASGIALLIASIGVALALRHIYQIVYTARTRSLTTNVPRRRVSVVDGTVTIGSHEVTLVVLAGALMIATHVLLQYTKLGTAMRAMADNEDLALVTGIPTERVVLTAWVVGGALTGAAGFLVALESGSMDTTLGWDLLLIIFAAVILGGIGSMYGAMIGGVLIGIAHQLSIFWLPSELMLAGAFAVMIVALLVRPQGLLGGVETV